MKRFKSPKQAQKFLSRFEFIHSFTKPMRHPPSLRYGVTGLIGAQRYRRTFQRRLNEWDKISLIPLTG